VFQQHSIFLFPTQIHFYQFVMIDELVKRLIFLASQAILGFLTRPVKLQELWLTPSNSLQFLTPDAS